MAAAHEVPGLPSSVSNSPAGLGPASSELPIAIAIAAFTSSP
jgi:hypothetical protein